MALAVPQAVRGRRTRRYGAPSVSGTATVTGVNTLLLASSTNVEIYESPTVMWSGLIWYLVTSFFLMRVFAKAERPGWFAFVPLLNTWTIIKIAGRGIGSFLLLLIPIVNVIVWIIVMLRFGRAFGKDGVFSFFLLVWLSLIGYIVIGVDDSRYNPAAVAN